MIFLPQCSNVAGSNFACNSIWRVADICRRCGACVRTAITNHSEGWSKCKKGFSILRRDADLYYGFRAEGCCGKYMPERVGFAAFPLKKSEVERLISIEKSFNELLALQEDLRTRGKYYVLTSKFVDVLRNYEAECGDENDSLNLGESDREALCLAYEDLVAFSNQVIIQRNSLVNLKSDEALVRFFDARYKFDDVVINALLEVCETVERIGRWLHDEGQYLLGLQGLMGLVQYRPREIKRKHIHSICAISLSLKLLRESSFVNRDGYIVYPIYSLFQRYRYCRLLEDVVWHFFRENNERFDERVKAVVGFESVVSNIFNNATKNLPPDLEHREVTISFRRGNDCIIIETKSYGPPRSREELDGIGRSEGYRGDHEKQKKYGIPGRGIGAFNARKYVERSGFRIQYDSVGATITSRINRLPYRIFIARIIIPNDCVINEDGLYDYSCI